MLALNLWKEESECQTHCSHFQMAMPLELAVDHAVHTMAQPTVEASVIVNFHQKICPIEIPYS